MKAVLFVCNFIVKVFPLYQKAFNYRYRVIPNVYCHE